MAVLTEHRLRIGERAVTLLEGPAGWGECSPLDGYPCDPAAARRAAEEAALSGWPAPVRSEVPVNALVLGPGFDPDALTGYRTVKVKVCAPEDIDLVARVRDAVGAQVRLRVDANGAWDVDVATDLIARLAALDVELVEQPVGTIDELARLRRKVSVPIAADECVRSVEDARRLQALDAADAVVLKVQPLGGVRAALAVAEASGVPAIPTSMMETSVGLSAGLALAAALPELPYACGLATAAFLAGDVTTDPLVPERGVLGVRAVAPDPELLARYAVSSQETRA
ncbi:MAG: enolase C-terminal domain-like protein [Acidimicrobiia bacterium]